jgi:hypothetical protein
MTKKEGSSFRIATKEGEYFQNEIMKVDSFRMTKKHSM